MDLKTKKKLDTVTVFDLMNNRFYIPDYQRGYRWTKLEVRKLLSDLEDYMNHNTDGSTFYCLQPLVVFFNKERDAWEVIDGQQRLTTLFLMLNQQRDLLEKIYPGMKLFELSYQSRPGSKAFLEQIDASRKNDNIDYYHMYNASQAIESFLKNEASLGAWRFVDAVVNAKNMSSRPTVKFIWYDVTEDIENRHISPEEKFADLNMGKIGLTNAELIKALFLSNVADDESEALRIASDWDNIEHALQDDAFWSFIYGKDDGKYATRIEFLFDIIQQKAFNEQNEYYTFDAYSDAIKSLTEDAKQKDSNVIKGLWKNVSDKYYLFKGWYENKKLYHLIGYLRYQKCDISEIEKIYDCPEVENVEQFCEKLSEKVRKYVDDTEIRNLNYHDPKDHKKIYDVLTLFNVLSIIDCEKEDVRFSFDDFYKHPNVFAKNHSDIIFDLMNWNNEDAEAYMSEIERVIYNGKTQL